MAHSNREARSKVRRDAKAAKKAEYKAQAERGKALKKGQEKEGFNAFKHGHLVSMCGNTGCKKCFPRLA